MNNSLHTNLVGTRVIFFDHSDESREGEILSVWIHNEMNALCCSIVNVENGKIYNRELKDCKIKVFAPKNIALNESEIYLVKCGNFIEAIKAVRARLNLPLRESKDLVDKARGL